ncbi:helix-hairpin-helix domain-containing protein [Niveibacterium sp.]|uniref:helix-hairpin-helix domain-containing protein n=1 Tax=Niveibacterium sp. TaxID=2017444 RepID=UPI0035B3BD59
MPLAPAALPKDVAAELQRIPGIGRAMAGDLYALGVRRVSDLAAADPQALYDRLCQRSGVRQDPCVLYTFRCAVYFARHTDHDPELLKWWNWKDRT